MDFVDWTTHVFEKLLVAQQASPDIRTNGLYEEQIADLVFGDVAPNPHSHDHLLAVSQAVSGLRQLGLIDERGFKGESKVVSYHGRQGKSVFVPLWEPICSMHLDTDLAELLRLINRLCPQEGEGFTLLKILENGQLLPELQWPGGDAHLCSAAQELQNLGLAWASIAFGNNLDIQPSYAGVVWETRKAYTTEARFLDDLLASGETANVELKQEQHTDTNEQKAEFVKDLLGLANTQVTARRWFVIGFDDTTRKYVGPPDEKMTQQNLEQLINSYIEPTLDFRYTVVKYYDGLVGKLEVIREREKLPYRVSKRLDYVRRRKPRTLEVGDWFVRHSSQTEPPSDDERAAIEAEGERARRLAER